MSTSDDILKIQTSVMTALAHPLRLKILERLRQGPCCVCKIIPHVGVEQSNVSHHLAVLKKAHIVRSEKRGLEVWYEVADRKVFDLIDLLTDFIVVDLNQKRAILESLTRGVR